mmetsp:Transcript_22759/g.40050  ORF Transcript_22759/g.40050 Transcript_22759/m.40050 type:complete len:174 (+) Transcript_22759:1-522(+)
MAAIQSQTCNRCHQPGHRAADCKVSFYRACNYCKEVGHDVKACQKLRDAKARAEARAARREAAATDAGSVSDESTTASTEAGWKCRSAKKEKKSLQFWQPAHWVLSESEEREARKLEKKLREITTLEQMRDEGKQLETLQLQKIERRSELEGQDVLRKVRLGYQRIQLVAATG